MHPNAMLAKPVPRCAALLTECFLLSNVLKDITSFPKKLPFYLMAFLYPRPEFHRTVASLCLLSAYIMAKSYLHSAGHSIFKVL